MFDHLLVERRAADADLGRAEPSAPARAATGEASARGALGKRGGSAARNAETRLGPFHHLVMALAIRKRLALFFFDASFCSLSIC